MTWPEVDGIRLETLARRIDKALDREDRKAFMLMAPEWVRVKRRLEGR